MAENTHGVTGTDKCETCGGARGGVPGNENRVDGKLMCDYCHGDLIRTHGVMGTSAPSISDEQIDTILREFGDEDVMRDLSAEEKRQRVRAAIAGVAVPVARHCQSGNADVCRASQRDGIVCPSESCDIDDGTRPPDGVWVPDVETFCKDADGTRRVKDE